MEESLLARAAAADGARCPSCGADLRIAPGDRCAACGAALVLRLGASPAMGLDWFVAGVLGLSAGLGLVVGGWAAGTWGSGFERGAVHHISSLLLAVGLAATLAWWTRVRARVATRAPRMRRITAAAWCGWGVLVGAGHLAFVISSRAV